MYSIITKDYVVQFNDEGYASSPLLRVEGSKGVGRIGAGEEVSVSAPPGETYREPPPPKSTHPQHEPPTRMV